ncbi:MAG: hypothetical protein Q8M06_11780 [Methanobacteriaceae archaeon]|jgi:hypothetical protein|nr:hypothetical protein [Methanobacteriaceae archaeon]MDZ4170589.1 hypothetical protein [Methanobacteriaceae archaeon]
MELSVIGMKRKHLICENMQGNECLVNMEENQHLLVEIMIKLVLGQIVHIRSTQEWTFKELI